MGISSGRGGGGFPGKQLGPQVGQLRQFDQTGGGFQQPQQQAQPYGKPMTGGEFQRPQQQPEPFGGSPYQPMGGGDFQQPQFAPQYQQPQQMQPQQFGGPLEQPQFGPKRPGGFVGQISPFLQRY